MRGYAERNTTTATEPSTSGIAAPARWIEGGLRYGVRLEGGRSPERPSHCHPDPRKTRSGPTGNPGRR